MPLERLRSTVGEVATDLTCVADVEAVKLVQPVWDGLKELGLELQVIVVNNYKIS
jgi:hypothetical protein